MADLDRPQPPRSARERIVLALRRARRSPDANDDGGAPGALHRVVASAGDRATSFIRSTGPGRLASAAGTLLLVALAAWWLLRAPPPPVEAGLPVAAGAVAAKRSTAATSAGGSTPGLPGASGAASASAPGSAGSSASGGATSSVAEVVVQAAGAVARPGVYRLPAGSRVADLVALAGGAVDGADPSALTLAARLVDGQRIYVPRPGEVVAVGSGPTGDGASRAAGGPLDLNAATAEQLDALPGVGPSTAAAIVAYRGQHGPFTSVDQLADVRGIGPAKLDALRPLVRV